MGEGLVMRPVIVYPPPDDAAQVVARMPPAEPREVRDLALGVQGDEGRGPEREEWRGGGAALHVSQPNRHTVEERIGVRQIVLAPGSAAQRTAPGTFSRRR